MAQYTTMNTTTMHEVHQYVEKQLDNYDLPAALSKIEETLKSAPNWDCETELHELQQTFSIMMDYIRNGTPDEHRKELYDQLIVRTHNLNDRMLFLFRTQSMEDASAIQWNDCKISGFPMEMPLMIKEMRKWHIVLTTMETAPAQDPKKDTETLQQYETYYSNLFTILLEAPHWTEDDLAQALTLINNEEIYKFDLALFIGAISLNLLVYFDERKLSFLCETAKSETNLQCKARALTSIATTCLRHNQLLKLYPAIRHTFQTSLSQEPFLVKGLRMIQEEMIQCQHTKEAADKMDKEILPTMLKSGYYGVAKFGLQNVEEEEKDPEAEEKRQAFEKSLHQLNDMHDKGMDVYMATFAHLKHYPFFNIMANWIYPFNPHHHAVRNVYFDEHNQPGFLNALLSLSPFCDSDCYSFCLLTGRMGTMEREMAQMQMGGMDLKEALSDFTQVQKENQDHLFLHEIRKWEQDLYRFFTLCPMVDKRLLPSPFEGDVNFLHNILLSEIMGERESALSIAENIYSRESYKEALVYFDFLEANGCREYSLYRRKGYCLQKLRNFKEAIDAYQKAELIKPGEKWVYRQLGLCLRKTGRYKEALAYYEKLEHLSPDNKLVLLRAGECLLQEGRYEEAQQRFFKVEYNEPNYLPALRAIAWCAFRAKDRERAEKYYGKILSLVGKPGCATPKEQSVDYLNAGHTALANKNLKTACERYSRYLQLSKDHDMKEAWKDFPILRETYQVTKEDFMLALLATKYI